MFESELCFMVVSFKKIIPYLLNAIHIVNKLTFFDVYNKILNCISILMKGDFSLGELLQIIIKLV